MAIGAYNGWELVVDFQDHMILQRSYHAHGRTFSLRVSAPRGVPASDVLRFFDSFRPADMDRPEAEPASEKSRQHAKHLEGPTSEVLSIGFSSDGSKLLAAAQDGDLTTWDVASSQRQSTTNFSRQPARFLALDWFPDRAAATASSLGGHLYLLDLAPFRDKALLIERLPEGVAWAVACSPDGKHTASAHDNGARLWTVTEPKLRWQLDHPERVNAAAFSPDSKTLAAATQGNRVTLWDVESGKAQRELVGRKDGVPSAGAVWALAWSPDGKSLAAGGNDRTLRLWDLQTHTERSLLRHEDTVRSAAFSPDSKFVATGDDKGAVTLWDGERGTRKARLPAEIVRHATRALTFSPDSSLLAAGWGKGVRLWRIADVRWEDAEE